MHLIAFKAVPKMTACA